MRFGKIVGDRQGVTANAGPLLLFEALIGMDAMDPDEPTSSPSRNRSVLTTLVLMTLASAGLAFFLAPYL